MHPRKAVGALGAAVLASRGGVSRHGLVDEVVHSLARVWIQVGFGQLSGDALKTDFVTFSVTVC